MTLFMSDPRRFVKMEIVNETMLASIGKRLAASMARLMKPTDVLPLLSCKQNFRCIWNAAAMCTCASLCAFSCISCPWHLNASHLTLHHVYRSFMCRQIGSIHMPHACWHKQSLACPLLRNNVMSPHECFHHPRSSLPIAHHLSVKIASHPTTKGMTPEVRARAAYKDMIAPDKLMLALRLHVPR